MELAGLDKCSSIKYVRTRWEGVIQNLFLAAYLFYRVLCYL